MQNINDLTEDTVSSDDFISIIGANENNLKNVSVKIPRNQLVVITGLSGSGKSSLAFDTLYAEGQRRYMETFSAYARQFIGAMDRPEVEKIDGLSPVISIEQKTTAWNPRSTVGTTTEIYDFLRLLYARVGEAYSFVTGEKMIKYTEEQIIEHALTNFSNKKVIAILAPVVSKYFLWFTAFVGANLLQSGFTCFCPAESVMVKLGMKRGDEASCGR